MFFNSKKSSPRNAVRSGVEKGTAESRRLVIEKRWVHRDQLELGMYVNELDKPWEETGFMFQGFMINDDETLMAVQDACEYANVQTEKLAAVSANSVHRLVGATRRSAFPD